MSSFRIVLFTAGALLLSRSAVAQCPDWSPQFAGDGFDDAPAVLASLDAGGGVALYAGGPFTVAGRATVAHVAKWDGVRWNPLGAGFNATVADLEAFDDGSGPALYATGSFTESGGTPTPRVARFDGSSWSAVGTDLGWNGTSLKSFDDGNGAKLYVAVKHTTQITNTTRVWRLDGSAWTQVGGDLVGFAQQFAVHDDGAGPALYITVGVNVLELVGGNWVQVGPSFPGRVFDLLTHDFGSGPQLVVSGEFTLQALRGVAVWDGANWNAIGHPNIDLGQVLALAEWNGELYSASPLPLAGGVAHYDGNGWTTIATATSDTLASRLAVHDDGSGHGAELYVSGNFHNIAGVRAQRVARFDGASWRRAEESQHALGIDIFDAFGDVKRADSIVRWRDPVSGRDKIVVGGGFDWTDDTPANGKLVAWDGLRWTSLGAGFDTHPATRVTGLSTYIDAASGQNYLLATGSVLYPSVQRFDGTSWLALGSLTHAVELVAARYPGSNGDTLFALEGKRVLRFDGVDWQEIGATALQASWTITGGALYDAPGSEPPYLYVTGNFPSIDGVVAPDIARWDGSGWSAVPGAPNASTPWYPVSDPWVLRDSSGDDHLVLAIGTDLWSFDGTNWTDWGVVPGELGGFTNSWLVEDDGSGPALCAGNGYRWRFGVLDTYIAPLPSVGPQFAIERDPSGAARAVWTTSEESLDGHPGRGVIRWTDACASLTTYCTAKVNSLGCTPAIGWSGEPSLAQSSGVPFEITASNVLNQKVGILFYGVSGRTAVPFQGGKNCVHSPVHRTPLRSSGGNVGVDDCSGVYAIDFTPWIDGTNDSELAIGVTVDAQWWSRDPASASTTGLTNAIEFEVRP